MSWQPYLFFSDGIRKPVSAGKFLLLALFSFGFLHVAVFNQGAYIHEFWIFYLTPWICLSSAVFLEKIDFRTYGKRTVAVISFAAMLGLLIGNHLFTDASKRIAWVCLSALFCAGPAIFASIFCGRRRAELRNHIIAACLVFYIIYSGFQSVWERMYWHTHSYNKTGELAEEMRT